MNPQTLSMFSKPVRSPAGSKPSASRRATFQYTTDTVLPLPYTLSPGRQDVFQHWKPASEPVSFYRMGELGGGLPQGIPLNEIPRPGRVRDWEVTPLQDEDGIMLKMVSIGFVIQWHGYEHFSFEREITVAEPNPYNPNDFTFITRAGLAWRIVCMYEEYIKLIEIHRIQCTRPGWAVGRGGITLRDMALLELQNTRANVWQATIRVRNLSPAARQSR